MEAGNGYTSKAGRSSGVARKNTPLSAAVAADSSVAVRGRGGPNSGSLLCGDLRFGLGAVQIVKREAPEVKCARREPSAEKSRWSEKGFCDVQKGGIFS
ncbi:hypothetical protein MRX96_016129 [Rhipicephalus microplus]